MTRCGYQSEGRCALEAKLDPCQLLSQPEYCCAQVSKAEKAMQKKQKAKEFTSAKSNSKVQKNLKRWN